MTVCWAATVDATRGLRGSMATFFIAGTALTLAGLALADRFGSQEILWGLSLMPATAIGFALSKPLLPVVDKGYTRPAILLLSTAAALVLLARAIFDF